MLSLITTEIMGKIYLLFYILSKFHVLQSITLIILVYYLINRAMNNYEYQ